MSDESTAMIAVQDGDEYICVHVERGGEKLGEWLKRYFSSKVKAKELVQLGNLETIDKRRVIACHRDNGEGWFYCQPTKIANVRLLFRWARFLACGEYLYIWMPNSRGTWRWRTFDCSEYYLYTEDADPTELTDKDGR